MRFTSSVTLNYLLSIDSMILISFKKLGQKPCKFKFPYFPFSVYIVNEKHSAAHPNFTVFLTSCNVRVGLYSATNTRISQ